MNQASASVPLFLSDILNILFRVFIWTSHSTDLKIIFLAITDSNVQTLHHILFIHIEVECLGNYTFDEVERFRRD